MRRIVVSATRASRSRRIRSSRASQIRIAGLVHETSSLGGHATYKGSASALTQCQQPRWRGRRRRHRSQHLRRRLRPQPRQHRCPQRCRIQRPHWLRRWHRHQYPRHCQHRCQRQRRRLRPRLRRHLCPLWLRRQRPCRRPPRAVEVVARVSPFQTTSMVRRSRMRIAHRVPSTPRLGGLAISKASADAPTAVAGRLRLRQRPLWHPHLGQA
mmetsp:Transcript_136488/g.340350  ORF Transcript_136488/g.340350 Transcript_136488/m.340350 type:complete len:212 (-) Transcript_136488:1330-1965(-)